MRHRTTLASTSFSLFLQVRTSRCRSVGSDSNDARLESPPLVRRPTPPLGNRRKPPLLPNPSVLPLLATLLSAKHPPLDQAPAPRTIKQSSPTLSPSCPPKNARRSRPSTPNDYNAVQRRRSKRFSASVTSASRPTNRRRVERRASWVARVGDIRGRGRRRRGYSRRSRVEGEQSRSSLRVCRSSVPSQFAFHSSGVSLSSSRGQTVERGQLVPMYIPSIVYFLLHLPSPSFALRCSVRAEPLVHHLPPVFIVLRGRVRVPKLCHAYQSRFQMLFVGGRELLDSWGAEGVREGEAEGEE